MADDNDGRVVDESKAESNQKSGWQKQHGDDPQGGGGGSSGGGGETKHAAGETEPPDRTGNRTGSRADDGSRRESSE